MKSFRLNEMKGPIRTAPTPPLNQQRYSPVTNWNDDPFTNDPFEPSPMFGQKKVPPPRPPPPKLQPNVPAKPSHFLRKPTVLTSLLSRNKSKCNSKQGTTNIAVEVPSNNKVKNLFPKCESKPNNVQTGSLIEFSTPPSSPTFTTRSSSDGLSIDSFGSDATSSTNNHNAMNGNASQAESGFEDDFDLFLNKKITKDDTFENFANFDPFSPPKTAFTKKALVQRSPDYLDPLDNGKTVVSRVMTHSKPTIIRANKPARPKPPDNSAILQSSLSKINSNVAMTINTSKPIEKSSLANDCYSTYGSRNEIYSTNTSNSFSWNSKTESSWNSKSETNGWESCAKPAWENTTAIDWGSKESSTIYSSKQYSSFGCSNNTPSALGSSGYDYERDGSPPMPNIPPPPPPQLDDSDIPVPEVSEWPITVDDSSSDDEEPYAIALYDFNSDQPEDLSFSANTRIKLIKRLDADWLQGRLKSGVEGMLPSNYVDIKVPLPGEKVVPKQIVGRARAIYDLVPSQPGDLPLKAGAEITIFEKINDEWYLGESNGAKGHFPANYVVLL